MKKHRKHAFTLVELLVVIGIIAVLISILLPAFSKARESSYRAKCMSNQRQLVQALMLYAQDWRGLTPPRATSTSGTTTSIWPHELWRYAMNTTRPAPPFKSYDPGRYWYNTVYNCPTRAMPDRIGQNSDFGYIYAFNTWLKASDDGASIEQRQNRSAKLFGVRRGAEVFLFLEVGNIDPTNKYQWGTHLPDPLAHASKPTILTNHHSGGTIATFVDGHGMFMRPKDFPLKPDGTYIVERYDYRWNGG